MLHWDERYGATGDYVFGTEPNEFLAAQAALIPPGPVLCLAEGEGRNAVFLAGRGHAVTAVDQSAVGLEKARRLAALRGVSVSMVQADLADFPIGPGPWSGIVAIFAHLPVALRRRVNAQIVAALRPGGIYISEVYAPRQLEFGTGGPKDVSLLVPLADVCAELAGLHFIVAREIERDVIEGPAHRGKAAVTQVVAQRK